MFATTATTLASTLRRRVVPSVDQLAVLTVAAGLALQLGYAALQPIRDSNDSTTSLQAGDETSQKLIVNALRALHDKKTGQLQRESGKRSSLAAASNAATISDEELISNAVTTLNTTGYLVIPGVFTGSKLSTCREDANELMQPDSEGLIVAKPGDLGGNDDAISREMLFRWVRPDVDGEAEDAAETEGRQRQQDHKQGGGLQAAIALIRSVPAFLESSQSTSYDRSDSHEVPNLCRLVVMPGTGAAYRPHRDATIYSIYELGLLGWIQARGYQRRVLTSILYLNPEDWDQECARSAEECKEAGASDDDRGGKDGSGCLRLHPDAEASDSLGASSSKASHFDVSPNGGTLVVFDARDILHEVLPTYCSRMTITSWVVGEHLAPS